MKSERQEAEESLTNWFKAWQEDLKGKTPEEQETLITESPLEVATGKEFSGQLTYMILLGTGGPAMRITGDLDEHGYPETAQYEWQNWGTAWTKANATEEEEAFLLDFASHFYFGE